MFGKKFTDAEASVLRYHLLQTMPDPPHLAEILVDFLISQGYGVCAKTALDAASKIGASGCSFATVQEELEAVALVM